uniref:Uncharacterized protein n=1 Tax=Panagrolaimus davidi TaxID=227884 RepID=A0A914QSK2_9BILA
MRVFLKILIGTAAPLKVTDGFDLQQSKTKDVCFDKSDKSSKQLNVSDLYHSKTDNSYQLKKGEKSSSKNSSTLSLHIAAYENLTEAFATFDDEKSDTNLSQLKKNEKRTLKQIISDLKLSNSNPFEFQRQENEGIKVSEVSKFKAFQQLLNPNKVSKNGSTQIGRSVKKRRLSPGQNPLVDRELDAKKEAEVQTDQTRNESNDDTIQQLPEENAELLDSTRTCNLADVIVNGKIDYERLNGKVLLVTKLYFNGTQRSDWNAGDNFISFEHSGFQISPPKLSVANHQNLSSVLNRIICDNIAELCLVRISISFSDYAKLTGNKISILDLHDVIVNDENGIKVGIDKLWKEVKNVQKLMHRFNDGEAMSEIAQKLVELAPFPNLKCIYLENVQDGFDLKTFYQFLIKNAIISCTLYCSRKCLKQMKDIRMGLPKFPTEQNFRIERYY